MIRIGYAKDIHKLVENRKLMLGGLHIPFAKGEEAHSDGDVVLHAIAEAMLGALALGDLGKYFPVNDHKYDNYPSTKILLEVYNKVKDLGFEVDNIDVSIDLEQPKLAGYINKMRENIANILKVDEDLISLKANTNEGLDAVGKGEATIATCVILLKSKE